MSATTGSRTIRSSIIRLRKNKYSIERICQLISASERYIKLVCHEYDVQHLRSKTWSLCLGSKRESYWSPEFPELEIGQTPAYVWDEIDEEEQRIIKHTDHENLKLF